jgi:hypothetical protein
MKCCSLLLKCGQANDRKLQNIGYLFAVQISSQPMKCRRQGLTDEFAQVQNLTAFRDVREQNLDKWMLVVGRGAALVFRPHDPLKWRKVQLAERVVLTAEQALSSSKVLDRLGPDVHHLPAYERLDSFRAIPGKEP